MTEVGVATTDVDHAVADALAAERHGFDFVGCGDHLFFGGPTPNPFVVLAAAAGATERIGLVSTVALLPLYPPALVAKLASTMDRVSRGRFQLGIGAGGEYPAEFAAVGVPPEDRFRRLEEGLRVVRALLSGERVTLDGDFGALQDVALDPPPSRPGGLPLWLGGRGRQSQRRAGRYADVWMPYMVTPERLGEGLAQARRDAVAAGRDAASVTGAAFVWAHVEEDGDRARRVGIETVGAAYRQDFAPLADRYLALGTPDRVTARLREFVEAGADHVLVQPACPPEQRSAGVALFAESVLPSLRRMTAGDA